MIKYSYKKTGGREFKKLLRFLSLSLFLLGMASLIYILYPLLSWQIYFAPTFASDMAVPIPKSTIVNSSIIRSLIATSTNAIRGVNYSNAQNWFPTFNPPNGIKENNGISFYSLSIPKLNIKDAAVSTIDNDLDKHLVNYYGTALPSNKGNSVIFGHSTLPQLFNPRDYKTIFATLHTLKINDEIFINIESVSYRYQIFNIIIVDPEETSIFTQNYDDSYLTLVTCTPPGTTWKRLILKARLQKI